MTLTLTLDRVILHTVMHHSSTSTYTPNFIEIEESFLWTDGRTDITRSTRRSRPKNVPSHKVTSTPCPQEGVTTLLSLTLQNAVRFQHSLALN